MRSLKLYERNKKFFVKKRKNKFYQFKNNIFLTKSPSIVSSSLFSSISSINFDFKLDLETVVKSFVSFVVGWINFVEDDVVVVGVVVVDNGGDDDNGVEWSFFDMGAANVKAFDNFGFFFACLILVDWLERIDEAERFTGAAEKKETSFDCFIMNKFFVDFF